MIRLGKESRFEDEEEEDDKMKKYVRPSVEIGKRWDGGKKYESSSDEEKEVTFVCF